MSHNLFSDDENNSFNHQPFMPTSPLGPPDN